MAGQLERARGLPYCDGFEAVALEPLGGHKWLFVCADCGGAASKLYRSWYATTFACWRCWGVVYERWDRGSARLNRFYIALRVVEGFTGRGRRPRRFHRHLRQLEALLPRALDAAERLVLDVARGGNDGTAARRLRRLITGAAGDAQHDPFALARHPTNIRRRRGSVRPARASPSCGGCG